MKLFLPGSLLLLLWPLLMVEADGSSLPVGYRAIDLGTLPGFPVVNPRHANESNEVVGSLFSNTSPSRTRPFYWSPSTGLVEIPLPTGADFGVAVDITDAGLVAVNARARDARFSFLWSPTGGPEYFPELDATQIAAINNQGQAVGMHYADGEVFPQAFLWDRDNGRSNFPRTGLGASGNLSGPEFADINEAGVAVGRINVDVFDSQLMTWDAVGGFRNLGDPPEGGTNNPSAINASGRIASTGIRTVQSRAVAAAYTVQADVATALVRPIPVTTSYAADINDQGVLLGRIGNSPSGPAPQWRIGPVLWPRADAEPIFVEDLIVPQGFVLELDNAFALSNAGAIVGSGRRDGRPAAWLLLPVPEPGGASLVGCGLTLFARRRGHAS